MTFDTLIAIYVIGAGLWLLVCGALRGGERIDEGDLPEIASIVWPVALGAGAFLLICWLIVRLGEMIARPFWKSKL